MCALNPLNLLRVGVTLLAPNGSVNAHINMSYGIVNWNGTRVEDEKKKIPICHPLVGRAPKVFNKN